ncbi:MAG: twin-arginine translocation signal domain-containing protein, partial [Atopobiaceae bacterium]|nr:twin-arginine translocation signal domain-containing protein [Atopobiaceae bacterium]
MIENNMNRRQFLTAGLGAGMALALAACGGGESSDGGSEEGTGAAFKVGLICLHDENSTYDLNFINGFNEAMANLGVSESDYMIKTNIPEGQECYDAAADLADAGCALIFADSFGHEDYMIQAAKEFPEVQFCHATGTKAHTEGLDNFH